MGMRISMRICKGVYVSAPLGGRRARKPTRYQREQLKLQRKRLELQERAQRTQEKVISAQLTQQRAQQHQERMTALAPQLSARHETFNAEHAGHMEALPATRALWLHTPTGVAVSAALYGVGLVLAFALNVALPLYVMLGVLAVLDWHNLVTLHGLIDWATLRLRGGFPFWGLVTAAVLFSPFWGVVYLAQCVWLVPSVREAQHAATQARIAALEQELGIAPTTPSDGN